MTWNYRIVKFKNTPRNKEFTGEDHYYALHEVYYNEAGKPDGITENPITFVCDEEEGPDGITRSLERALKDAKNRPVLRAEDLTEEQ